VEINLIAGWLNRRQFKVRRFDDSAPKFEPAKKAAILDRLPRADLFHIACHGVFKADAPDQSGLVLIPQPDAPEILSLRELSDLNLADLRHATLSSCWSADHFILPGRWIISLPETLWRAGARSILGCLWVVSDDLTVAFMRRFYERLETCPRDEALQLTQLECLRRKLPNCEIEDQSNLYYWAGYNLYGDHERLNL
jgi:CHAT domain-containing protein